MATIVSTYTKKIRLVAIMGFVLPALFMAKSAHAQLNADFNIPASVCINQTCPVENNSTDAVSYEWDFCEGDFNTSLTAAVVAGLEGAFNPKDMDVIADGLGNWYAFVTSRSTATLFRYFFEGSLASTPVVTNLGNPGSMLNGPEQIKIIEENGLWYGIVVNGANSTLLRLTFGPSLNSTPAVQEILTGISTFNSGMDIARDGSLITAVITNSTANTLSIINFGNSITNNPEPNDIITTGAIPDAVALDDIQLLQFDNVWYGFLIAFNSRTIHRLKFGPVLFAVPQSTTITPPAFTVNQRPSGIRFAFDAGSAFLFVQTFAGDLFKLELGNNIENNIPVVSPLGNLNVLQNSVNLELLKSNSQWFGFVINQTELTVSRLMFQSDCYSDATSLHESPLLKYSAPGQYVISLTSFASDGEGDYIAKEITVENRVAPQIQIQSVNICAQSVINFSLTTDLPIESYHWDFGDSSLPVTDPAPAHSFPSAGEFQITATVVADNTCVNTYIKPLKLYDQPDADFMLPPTLICTNNEITVQNRTIDKFDGNLSTEWLANDVHASFDFDFVTSFSTTGTKTIKLIASIPGCVDEKVENTSFVQAGPVIDFNFTGKCTRSLIVFQNTITEPVLSYLWEFGDNESSSSPNAEHVYTEPGLYSVRLEALSANGCNNSIVKEVTIDPTPLPDFSIDGPPSSCTQATSKFFDSTPLFFDSQIESWHWNFDDGATSSEQNPAHIFETAGQYDVELTVITEHGCSDVVVLPVTILQSPSLNFDNSAACVNKPVSFTASSDNAVDYYWEIGTSFYETQTASHSFSAAGPHVIKLNAIGSNGCVTELSRSIMVPVPFVPAFTFENNCVDRETRFTTQPQAGDPVATYHWNFGGEGTSAQSDPTFKFASLGNKTVGLQVTAFSGCVYQSSSTVNVIESPRADFSFTPSFGVPPQEISLINTSTNATIFNWDFGDGTSSIEKSPNHTFSELGDYSVKLTSSNSAGCESTIQKSISMVAPLPDVDLNLMTITPNNDGTLKVIITIENKGNTFLRDLPVKLDVSGAVTLETIVDETIAPFSFYNLVMDFAIAKTSNLEFLCASATLNGDLHPEGNRICEQLNSRLAVITPHPNPVSDFILLEWIAAGSENIEVELTDLQGKTVLSTIVTAEAGLNRSHVDVKSLRSGTYILRIVSPTRSETHRILISH